MVSEGPVGGNGESFAYGERVEWMRWFVRDLRHVTVGTDAAFTLFQFVTWLQSLNENLYIGRLREQGDDAFMRASERLVSDMRRQIDQWVRDGLLLRDSADMYHVTEEGARLFESPDEEA